MWRLTSGFTGIEFELLPPFYYAPSGLALLMHFHPGARSVLLTPGWYLAPLRGFDSAQKSNGMYPPGQVRYSAR